MSKEIRKPYIDTDVVESFLNEIAVLEKALRYIKSDDCVANIQDKIDILIQEIENICSSYEVLNVCDNPNDDLFKPEEDYEESQEVLLSKFLDDKMFGLDDNYDEKIIREEFEDWDIKEHRYALIRPELNIRLFGEKEDE